MLLHITCYVPMTSFNRGEVVLQPRRCSANTIIPQPDLLLISVILIHFVLEFCQLRIFESIKNFSKEFFENSVKKFFHLRKLSVKNFSKEFLKNNFHLNFQKCN